MSDEMKDKKPKENDDSDSMEFEIPDEDYLKDLDILSTLEKDREEDADLEDMMKISEEDMIKMSDIDLDLDEDTEVKKILDNLDKEDLLLDLDQEEKVEDTLNLSVDEAEKYLPEPEVAAPAEKLSGTSEPVSKEDVIPLDEESAPPLDMELTSLMGSGDRAETGLQMDEADLFTEKAFDMESMDLTESPEGKETGLAWGEADIPGEKEFPIGAENLTGSEPGIETGSGGSEGDMLLGEELSMEMGGSALKEEMSDVEWAEEKAHGDTEPFNDALSEETPFTESGRAIEEEGEAAPPAEPIEEPVISYELPREILGAEVIEPKEPSPKPIGEPEMSYKGSEATGVEAVEPKRPPTERIEEYEMGDTGDYLTVGAPEPGPVEVAGGPPGSESVAFTGVEIEPRTSDVDLRLSDSEMAKFKQQIQVAETLQGYIKKLNEYQSQLKEKIYRKLLTEYQTRRADIFNDPEFIQMREDAKKDLYNLKSKKEEFELKLEDLKDDLEEIKVRHLVGEYDDRLLAEKEEEKKDQINSWSDRISRVDSTISFYQELLNAEGLSGKPLLEETVEVVGSEEEAQREEVSGPSGAEEVSVEDMLEEIDLSPGKSPVAMVTCNRCGKQTPANERFCTKCGAKLKR